MNQSNVLRSKEALLLANLLTKERQGRDDKGVHKLAGNKEKDVPKGFSLYKTWSVMASVGTGGVELDLR